MQKRSKCPGARLWAFQVMMWATVVGVDQIARPLSFDVIRKSQMFQPCWPMQLRWRISKSRWRSGRARDIWWMMGRLIGSTGLCGQEEGWCSHHHQQNFGPWAAASCSHWRFKGKLLSVQPQRTTQKSNVRGLILIGGEGMSSVQHPCWVIIMWAYVHYDWLCWGLSLSMVGHPINQPVLYKKH